MMTKPFANTFEEQAKLIDPTKPVRVYRNLHRNCFSVKQGVVRFHTDKIYLKDVSFVVSEKSRQRVIIEKRKNVHAFVVGTLTDMRTFLTAKMEFNEHGEIRYNPYKSGFFNTTSTGLPVVSSETCLLHRRDGLRVEARGLNFKNPLDNQPECDILESVETHLL